MNRLIAAFLLCAMMLPEATAFALVAPSPLGLPGQVRLYPPSPTPTPLPPARVSIERAETPVRANSGKAEAESLKQDLFSYVKQTGSVIGYTKLKMLEFRFPPEKTEQKNPYSNYTYTTYPPHHSSFVQPSNRTLGNAWGSLASADIFGLGLSGNPVKQEVDLMTGAKAVNESLQLGSIDARRVSALDGAETVPLSQVKSVEIRSHPWETMRGGKPTPVIPSLLDHVPADALVVYFDRTASAKELEDGLRSIGSVGADLFDLDAGLSVSNLIGSRLGVSDLGQRLASGFTLEDMAFVSEDLDFVRGTEFALVLKPKNGVLPETILAFVDKSIAHTATIGDIVVLATSQRYLDVITGSASHPISREPDLAYALSVLEPARDGFVYFSEAFIRKLTGPGYRTASARRTAAMGKVSSLQYLVFGYHSLTGAWPKNFTEIAAAKYADPALMQESDRAFTINSEGLVASNVWGTLAHTRSVGDVPVIALTEGERNRYDSFREGYEQLWREFFDPIGIAFRAGDHLAFHTIVLPLIEDSEYNFVKGLFRSSDPSRPPFDGITRVPRSAPILLLARFDLDRYLLENDAVIMESIRNDDPTFLTRTISTSQFRQAIQEYYGKKKTYGSAKSCTTGIFADPLVARELAAISAITKTTPTCAAASTLWAVSWPIASTSLHGCVDAGNSWSLRYSRAPLSGSQCPAAVTWTEHQKEFTRVAKNAWNTYTPEEKKAKINALINEESQDLKFSEPINVFGLIGNEIQFGIGESLPFEISNIVDYDGYLAIKLRDVERFKKYLNDAYRALAEDMSSGGGYGMFALSTKEPMKNSYNGVEYYVIPTGFVNLYYLYRGEYVYFFISQLGVNNMIAGITATSTAPSLTPLQLRAKQDTGEAADLLLLADLTPFDAYRRGIMERAGAWGGYALTSEARQLHGYLTDFQLTMRMAGGAQAKETFFTNVPRSFRGVPVSVTPTAIRFRESGPVFSDVDFGEGKTVGMIATTGGVYYGYSGNTTQAVATSTVKFATLVSPEEKERLIDDAKKLKGFGVGLAFTPEGIDVRLSIKNPLQDSTNTTTGLVCNGPDCATWHEGLSGKVLAGIFGLLTVLVLIGIGALVWKIRRSRSLGSELAAPAAISNLGSTLDTPSPLVQGDTLPASTEGAVASAPSPFVETPPVPVPQPPDASIASPSDTSRTS